MRRKTTDEYKKEIYDLVGDEYTVLGEYITNKDKILMRHNVCGTEYEVTPIHFKAGNRCRHCENLSRRKTTDEYKKEVYEKWGDEYTVLGEYINCNTKILVRHNICGREFEIRAGHLLEGIRCDYCNKKDIKKKHMKRIFNDIERLVGDEYTLLSKKVENGKIRLRHNTCGHEFYIKPDKFISRGDRCPNCSVNKMKTYEEVVKEIYKLVGDEYTLLSTEYVNNKAPLLIRHNKCGFEYTVSIHHFARGHRCPKCYGTNLRTQEEFEQLVYDLVGNEYTVLGKYINSSTKILMRHNKCGHEWEITPSNFIHHGNRCPSCLIGKNTSYLEDKLVDYIKSIYKNLRIKTSIRNIIPPKEIDIYIPKFKLAFEIDGIYWHSNKFLENDYHISKTEHCEEKGIRLIHIFEDELYYKPRLVQEKIKTLLGKNNKSIYARETYIKEITNERKDKFLNKYHIQGTDKSSIRLGLYAKTYHKKGKKLCFEKNKLVAVMTFCKPRRSLGHKDSIYDYELSRYATKSGYNVIGGFSKLLKYFEKYYYWEKIITYADRRWSQGDVYLKNGFEFIRYSKPSYWYVKGTTKRREHRYNYRKSKLKDLFPEIYDDSKTEEQIMREAGYLRIYDCGNMVFEYVNQYNNPNEN